MLKWADETRRKLDSIDNDSRAADNNADSRKSNIALSEGSWSDDESAIIISTVKSSKSSSPVQRRRQKNLQTAQQRRRHSSCCQLYASPEEIVLGWNNKETKRHRQAGSNSVPSTPTDNSNTQFSVPPGNNNNLSPSKTTMNQNDSSYKISTKPELLQITTKQSDKNRQSFWKNLIGKKSWPSRTYKSPMRKSQSVVETYRKIDESYYIEPEETDRRASDYGLSELVISCNTPNDSSNITEGERIRSYHSLKTIRRQNEFRRPKLFTKHSTGRNRSPDGGFSDIRLSMSVGDDFDCERDSGVPRSPTLSSSSSSSDDSACYRKH